MLNKILRFVALIFLIASPIHAQIYYLDYPADVPNTRYYTDEFNDNIVRPALSIRGFERFWGNKKLREADVWFATFRNDDYNPDIVFMRDMRQRRESRSK